MCKGCTDLQSVPHVCYRSRNFQQQAALALLQHRLPLIQQQPEQRYVFWDMIRRLRATAQGRPEVLHPELAVPNPLTNTSDARWMVNGLPPFPDAPPPTPDNGNAILQSAKAGRGKTFALNAVMSHR